MAVSKLSAIAASGANVASGDFLVGVTAANADVLFSRAQAAAGVYAVPTSAGTLSAPGLSVGESGTGLVGQIAAHTLSVACNQIEVVRFNTIASGANYLGATPGLVGTPYALTVSSSAAASATQAGVGLTITADPAVAGTVTAGAAAGGTITYVAGNAARLTSGNANGGNHLFLFGSGIGTGTAGLLQVGGSSASFAGFYSSSSTPNGRGLVVRAADNSATGDLAAGTVNVVGSIRAGGVNATTGASGNTVLYLNVNSNLISLFKSGGGAAVRFSRTLNAENNLNTGISVTTDGILSIDSTSINDSAGQIQCASTAAGSGTATFASTNCPAVTVTSVFTWIKMIDQSGNQVYLPAWK